MKLIRISAILLLLLCILTNPAIYATSAPVSKTEEKIYYSVDIPAQYTGGFESFRDYVDAYLQYPDSEYTQGIKGKVIVKFIVRTDGRVDSIQVLKGLTKKTDEEAIRLISSSKRWQSAYYNNRAVSSYLVYPVEFNITDSINKKVGLNEILVSLDNKIMPSLFDISLVDPAFISSGKYIKPYPKSVADSLSLRYGKMAGNGVLEMFTTQAGFIQTDSEDPEFLIVNNEKIKRCRDSITLDTFEKYLSKNLSYPILAQELNKQGNANIFIIVNDKKEIVSLQFDKSGSLFFCNTVLKTFLNSDLLAKQENLTENKSFISIPLSFSKDSTGLFSISIGKNVTFDSKGEIKPNIFFKEIKITDLLDLSIIKHSSNEYLVKVENCNDSQKDSQNSETEKNDWCVNIQPLTNSLIIETTCYVRQVLKSDTNNKISQDDVDENVFVVVEEMPVFPGGDSKLFQFLGENIKYPVLCQELKISGRVITNFEVWQDGSVRNVSVFRSPHELLSEEAVRIVKLMPKWIPGKQRGKTVKVRYTLPINFRIH